MRRWVARGGAGGVWLAVSLTLVLAVMAFAVRLAPAPLRIPGIGLQARGEAGRAPARFAPLSAALLADVLGGRAASGLFGAAPMPAPHPEDGRRDTTPRPPDQGEEGQGDLPTPEELTREPRVSISMRVDRVVADPGDTLVYSITVRNDGSGTAKEVRVTSHVPEHTQLVAGAECDGENVRIAPNPNAPGGYTVCVSAPGLPAPGPHGIQIGYGPLNPGRQETFVFRVAIDANAPRGFLIRNHAHVDGPDLARQDSNEVATRVR